MGLLGWNEYIFYVRRIWIGDAGWNVMNWIFVYLANPHLESLTPDVMVFRDGSLWEEIRARWCHDDITGLPWQDSCLHMRKRPEHPLSHSHMRPQQECSCLKARKKALTRNQICQHTDFGFPCLQNCKK